MKLRDITERLKLPCAALFVATSVIAAAELGPTLVENAWDAGRPLYALSMHRLSPPLTPTMRQQLNSSADARPVRVGIGNQIPTAPLPMPSPSASPATPGDAGP